MMVYKYKTLISINLVQHHSYDVFSKTRQLTCVVSLHQSIVESTFLHVHTDPATPSWANKTVCLRAGTLCQLIQNMNKRGNQVYIFTPLASRPHVHADGCLFILGKERGWPIV